ncbi:MAG TPA: FABP family protein, partial [Anaerolineales bacterium]|nr:FABP family protein [Anaerolineales bacterium]
DEKHSVSSQILSLLEGTWVGEGRGQFPGVTSFNYRETLTYMRRDENSLTYEQKTQKLYDGQTEYMPSHAETGSIRLLENGELELVSAQTGRNEVLTGSIESVDAIFRIHFVSKSITNDPRMISSTRTFELDGDTLRYEMGMHTTKVEGLTPHLKITLQRVE